MFQERRGVELGAAYQSYNAEVKGLTLRRQLNRIRRAGFFPGEDSLIRDANEMCLAFMSKDEQRVYCHDILMDNFVNGPLLPADNFDQIRQGFRTKPLIVIADINETLAKNKAYCLEGRGFDCINVNDNASLALLTSTSYRPDLVIMDVMMPGLSGHDFMGIFNKMAIFNSTPVIFNTARGTEEDIQVGERLGVPRERQLIKPYPLNVLAEVVSRNIAQSY